MAKELTANVPVKFLFEGSNNMVSGADSAKKIKVHSCFLLKKVILIKNQKNNSDLDMISLFLLNMLLLPGKINRRG